MILQLGGEWQKRSNRIRSRLGSGFLMSFKALRSTLCKFNYKTLFSILLIFGILFSGCSQKLPEKQDNQPQSNEPSPGIALDLSISGTPVLDQPVSLTATATSFMGEVPNQTVQIFLPEGFVLVDGNLTWTGTLHGAKSVKLNATIKAVKKGEWKIEGIVGPRAENKDFLYIRTNENSGEVSPLPFDYPDPSKRRERPPDRPFVIKLSLSGSPYLNNPIELTAAVASVVDIQNTTINVFLPEGFELVEGDLSWSGDLQAIPDGLFRIDDEELARKIAKGKSPMDVVLFERLPKDKQVQFKAIIKAVKTGDWQIVALPIKERPFAINCPGIDTAVKVTEKDSWQFYTVGGCLNIRVSNDTALVSEITLPPYSSEKTLNQTFPVITPSIVAEQEAIL